MSASAITDSASTTGQGAMPPSPSESRCSMESSSDSSNPDDDEIAEGRARARCQNPDTGLIQLQLQCYRKEREAQEGKIGPFFWHNLDLGITCLTNRKGEPEVTGDVGDSGPELGLADLEGEDLWTKVVHADDHTKCVANGNRKVRPGDTMEFEYHGGLMQLMEAKLDIMHPRWNAGSLPVGSDNPTLRFETARSTPRDDPQRLSLTITALGEGAEEGASHKSRLSTLLSSLHEACSAKGELPKSDLPIARAIVQAFSATQPAHADEESLKAFISESGDGFTKFSTTIKRQISIGESGPKDTVVQDTGELQVIFRGDLE